MNSGVGGMGPTELLLLLKDGFFDCYQMQTVYFCHSNLTDHYSNQETLVWSNDAQVPFGLWRQARVLLRCSGIRFSARSRNYRPGTVGAKVRKNGCDY